MTRFRRVSTDFSTARLPAFNLVEQPADGVAGPRDHGTTQIRDIDPERLMRTARAPLRRPARRSWLTTTLTSRTLHRASACMHDASSSTSVRVVRILILGVMHRDVRAMTQTTRSRVQQLRAGHAQRFARAPVRSSRRWHTATRRSAQGEAQPPAYDPDRMRNT